MTSWEALERGGVIDDFVEMHRRSISGKLTGLSQHLDSPLEVCLAENRARWASAQHDLRTASLTMLPMLSKRCLSVGEILVLQLLYRSGRCCDQAIRDELGQEIEALSLDHYNPQVNFREMVETFAAPTGRSVICPELRALFTGVAGSIIGFLKSNPQVFEGTLETLVKPLREQPGNEMQLDRVDEGFHSHLWLVGHDPESFSDIDLDIKLPLVCWERFENGEQADLLGLLLTHQIVLRAVKGLRHTQENVSFSEDVLQSMFGDLGLLDVLAVDSEDPQLKLFGPYAGITSYGPGPFVQSRIALGGETFVVGLPLVVLYLLFGLTNREHIDAALRLCCEAAVE